MPDAVKAVVSLLKADADVAALVGARVFGGELPESEQQSMPRACLVVRKAGGGAIGTAWEDYGDLRFDVFSYGSTAHGADDVERAVHRRMKTFARVVSEGTLLHWARRDGGPLPLSDPNTTWRYVFSSWQVLVSEVAAT